MKASKAFKPPFKHLCGKIHSRDFGNIVDIRGWGHLIGIGALNLNAEEAAEIQDKIGDFIAKLLTENWSKIDNE